MRMLSNFQRNVFRSFRLYLIIVLGLLVAYFVYVILSRGLTYALSIENLEWFGTSFLLYSAIAALVAILTCLTSSD